MSNTIVATNSALAVKLYGGALFTRLTRRNTFRGKLTGPAPKDGDAASQLKGNTSSGFPVVRMTDLSAGPGDRLSYDIVNTARGKPTMGDRRLAGRMMKLDFASQDIVINQSRFGIDAGGRMTRKRTVWDTRKISMANLYGINNRMLDQLICTHLAGARGYDNGLDWAVPLASDPDFADICVNPVVPPSYNRRYIGSVGFGTTSQIDSTQKLSLKVLDDLRTYIDGSDYPLQSCDLADDGYVHQEDDPLYVLVVSSIGYNQLRATSTDKDWNTLTSNAIRMEQMTKHPLFGNGALYWRGIVVRQAPRPIRFYTGSSVSEYTSAGVLQTATATAGFDRGLLLGAQALAEAWGSDSGSGMPIKWYEQKVDHDNILEVSTSMIGGYRKLTFALDGVTTDHGVWAIDYANGQ